MGKASRRKREARGDPPRTSVAAELAGRADRAASQVVAAVESSLSLLTGGRYKVTLDPTAWPEARANAIRNGVIWPPWSWVPCPVITSSIHRDLGDLLGRGADPADTEMAVAPLAPVVNWLPGRTAVFFDADLLSSLSDTGPDERIPVEALHRLPGWALYLDCPFLGPGAGAFACLDPGDVQVPGAPDGSADELMVTFVLGGDDEAVVQVSLRLPEETVGAGLAALERDRRKARPTLLRSVTSRGLDELSNALGHPVEEALSVRSSSQCSFTSVPTTRTCAPTS